MMRAAPPPSNLPYFWLFSLLAAASTFLPVVQPINDVWHDLGLPNNNEMADIMTSFQMQEFEDHTRSLSSRSGSAPTLGEKCSNRNACSEEEDLQCTRAVFGKRCQPKDCFQRGLAKFKEEFDMDAYKQTILQQAGLTEGQIHQAFDDSSGSGGDRNSFLQTDVFQSLQEAMNRNNGPAKAIFNMYDECTASGEGSNGTDPLDLNRVAYQGVHIEAGIFLDGALDFFWEESSGTAFTRYCIGFTGITGGAEISFIYLIAQMTSDIEAIAQGCTLRLDINFGIGLNLGEGYGFGLDSGVNQLEFTAGLGASVSGGIGICGIDIN